MTPAEIAALLKEKFGDTILETKIDGPCPACFIDAGSIQEVCRFLHDEEKLIMDHLELLGGADYKDRIEVVYVMTSLKHNHRITLKCRLPREGPIIASVESVWGVANWHERETYDMYGVVFEGHGDLRRILCPDDWDGYPLRKDYKYPTRYRDMPV